MASDTAGPTEVEIPRQKYIFRVAGLLPIEDALPNLV
jgi:hypothetical protein